MQVNFLLSKALLDFSVISNKAIKISDSKENGISRAKAYIDSKTDQCLGPL